MVRYVFYQKNPASHYVYIDMHFDAPVDGIQQLQLAAWRPGRYELGNFAKNVKKLEIWKADNSPVVFEKLNKDLWQFEAKKGETIKVTYSYYAAEMNAGACFADPSQIYINPVHCCLALARAESQEHLVELQVPDNYRFATSMPVNGKTMKASNYEELVDSPFVASAMLKSDHYVVAGKKFFLHFNGECQPDFNKIKKDFSAFTENLISFWKEMPVDEYHFIFQVLPQKFYHGVEHLKSTVIALGPAYQLNADLTYEDLLGVSCHELFHLWNVKTIRPKEMMPYDYTRENYASTGYVYEGFTTYYGDKLLLASSVFTEKQYFGTLQERLQKHFHNFGRYNLSLAQSSWETWLDGYVPGAPYRKTNIYDEGCLFAFMLDVELMKRSGNKRSLRDICLLLYERFGKKSLGYSEKDVVNLACELGGADMKQMFDTYVYAPADFEKGLTGAFDYLGLEMIKQKGQVCESNFGFKVAETPLQCRISLVAPYSPAWKAGLFGGDDIVAVNGMMVRGNLNHWLGYFSGAEKIVLHVSSGDVLRSTELPKGKEAQVWFFEPQIRQLKSLTEAQKKNFEHWQKN